MALLRVIVGPDVGKTADVTEDPVTIGRGAECGLRLTDPHVSIIHAAVEPLDKGWRVRDLETSGGTGVNGERVFERRLTFGDILKVGATLILFGSGDAAVDSHAVGSTEAPGPAKSDAN